jgi:glutaredoxin|tara:strand:- start:1366 stop:1650 length:285 start_codon:yes stop_codon:yes gene_type:complete
MKKVILYTMKGCPHCDEAKQKLRKERIRFIERDIHKFEKEYDLFVEAKDNEYIPSFMLMTINKDKVTSNVVLLAPDDDFEELEDAIEKVKQYLK